MEFIPMKCVIDSLKTKGKPDQWMLFVIIGPHPTKEEAEYTKKHIEFLLKENNDDLLLAQDEGIID